MAIGHCTMRTLESRNSSGLIAPGHISKNHQRYSKERHFFFKLSTRRKIEKIQFPWVSYSKFSILAKYASVSYTQICIWYRAILLEDASDASVPLYKYGSILHTVPPYFPMYALCSVLHFIVCQCNAPHFKALHFTVLNLDVICKIKFMMTTHCSPFIALLYTFLQCKASLNYFKILMKWGIEAHIY